METNLLPPVFTFVTGNCKSFFFFLNMVPYFSFKLCEHFSIEGLSIRKPIEIINVVSPLFKKQTESHFNDCYIHKIHC